MTLAWLLLTDTRLPEQLAASCGCQALFLCELAGSRAVQSCLCMFSQQWLSGHVPSHGLYVHFQSPP